MNTTALRKQYHHLSARERLAALITADARGDAEERRALMDSAPRLTISVPHTHGLASSFYFLALWHVAGQLESAWSMAALAHLDDDKYFDAVGLAAYRMGLQAEAWRAFCAEMGIDSTQALSDLPGAGVVLDFAELVARQMAPTRAEAEACFQKLGGEAEDFPMLESLTASLRAALGTWQ